MHIEIRNVREDLLGADKADLTFLQSEQITGDLKIVFNNSDDEPEIFYRADINIPVFVAEMRLFLQRVRKGGHSTWKVYFAPFLDGRLEENNIVLTRGTRTGDIKVVEIITPDRLTEIESLLSSLARDYGYLRPLPENP